jgi:hypothetical protein
MGLRLYMPPTEAPPGLTPLQRVVYETDLLNLSLRDSIKLASARMGYFVGQYKYLQERAKVASLMGADAPTPES